jgi:hypothetical protein
VRRRFRHFNPLDDPGIRRSVVSTKIIVLTGVACVVAAAVSWRVAAGRAKPAKPTGSVAAAEAEPTTAPANARAMQERLELLEARVAGLQEQLAERGAAAPLPARALAAAPDGAPDPATDERRLEEHMRQVEASFDVETRDPRWARETASKFQDVVAGSDQLKKAFQGIECRSSTCRLEMLDDRSREFYLRMSDLARAIGSELPTMNGERTTRPDGTAVAIYYYTKGS